MIGRARFQLPTIAVVIFGAWIGVSMVSAVQSSLRDPTRSWSALIAGTLLAWLPWLIFSVPIVRMSRSEWTPGHRLGFVARHALSAGVCSALYLAYLALFRALPRPAALGAWRAELTDVAGEHLIGALLVYAVIAAMGRLTMKSPVPDPAKLPEARGIAIRRRGRTRFIAPTEIDWVEAEGSYARLHLGERSELLRRPLSRLAAELEALGFVRVHRSALVNLDRVREVETTGHGDGTLVLADGTRVRMSRTYRGSFERAMQSR